MIFPKQTKWRKGINCPIEELKAKELNENTNKRTKFWLKVWQDWALAREYDVHTENYPILSCYIIINK
jgi:hypothetical protein